MQNQLTRLQSDVIKLQTVSVDLSDTQVSQTIIDLSYEKCSSGESLSKSKKAQDWTRHNIYLWLRDFVSVVEVNQSPRTGDIDQLMIMGQH